MVDILSIPLNDIYTWDMICEGKVKGCFQIESYLGKKWCRKIKPRSIEELSDVIALIRPGCLASSSNGKSMTDIYCDTKNGSMEIKSLHPLLDDLLNKTHGIIVYQEQSMKIAEIIAGFTLEQADDLRKAIGKKKADLMKEVRLKFIEGAIKNGTTNEKAVEIFDIIEKSNRYSFNASHSVCYAMLAYWSAYLRCHHKKEFYKNWLATADGKLDPDAEKKELVLSARADDVNVFGPHYTKTNDNFEWDYEDNGIRFGLCNIKNVGAIHTKTLKEKINNLNEKISWISILVNVLPEVNKRAVENMISVGVFSGLGMSRTEMLHEFSCISDLTDKELLAIKSLLPKKSLIELISEFIKMGLKKNGGLISTTSRLTKLEAIRMRLENPGRSLKDNPSVYSKLEESLLGCWVHQSELSASADAVYADTTCLEISEGKLSKSTVAAIIRRIKVHKTQKGEDMCFLSVEDSSGELENIVIFTELYGQNKDIIYQDSTVLMTGEIKDRERKSFIVESIFQI